MLLAAYTRYRDSQSEVFLSYFLGTSQFTSGVAFVVAFAFSWAISQRPRMDHNIVRLNRMINSSNRVIGQITEFRTQTDHKRFEPTKAPLVTQLMKAKAEPKKKAP